MLAIRVALRSGGRHALHWQGAYSSSCRLDAPLPDHGPTCFGWRSDTSPDATALHRLSAQAVQCSSMRQVQTQLRGHRQIAGLSTFACAASGHERFKSCSRSVSRAHLVFYIVRRHRCAGAQHQSAAHSARPQRRNGGCRRGRPCAR